MGRKGEEEDAVEEGVDRIVDAKPDEDPNGEEGEPTDELAAEEDETRDN